MEKSKIQKEFEVAKQEHLNGKYLEYDDEWKNLFTWLRENIVEGNFVSKSMEETVKNTEFSEEALNSIDSGFPGIFEVKEGDVKRLEGQLKVLKKAEQEFLEQNHELGKLLQSNNEKVREMSKKAADAECEHKIIAEEVSNLQSQLDSLAQKKTEAVRELMEIQKHPQEIMACYQIPMDCIGMNMGIMNIRLEASMMAFNTDGSAKEARRLSGKIESVVEHSLQIYEDFLETRTDLAGMENMIACMDSFVDFGLRKQEIDSQMAEIDQMTMISRAKIEDFTAQCMFNKKREIDRDIKRIHLKIYENKKVKALDRLARVREIGKITKDYSDIVEILWILMQIDNNKIEKFFKIMNQGNQLNQAVENFLWNVNKHDLRVKLSFLTVCGGKIDVEYILDPQRNDQLLERFAEFDKIEHILKSLIRGSISAPIVIAPEVIMKQHMLAILSDQDESKLKWIKDRFKREFLEPMNSNRLWGYRRMLWIWFLTNPKKLLDAIKCASASATKKSKALPGIGNKQ